jgi:hypothetical protein
MSTDIGERRPTDSAIQPKVFDMTELTQDEIDQVHGGGFFSKLGKFLGFCVLTYLDYRGIVKLTVIR